MESMQNFYQLVQNYVMHKIHLFAQDKENQPTLINKQTFTVLVNGYIQEAVKKIINDLYQVNNLKIKFINTYKTAEYVREVLILQNINHQKILEITEKLPNCSFEYNLAIYEDGIGFGYLSPVFKENSENLDNEKRSYQELNKFLAYHLEKKANLANNQFQGMLLINNQDNVNQVIIPAERMISFINIASQIMLINNNKHILINSQNLFDLYEEMLSEKKNIEEALSDSILNSFA